MVQTLTGKNLKISELTRIARGGKVSIAPTALTKALRSKRFLDAEAKKRVIYGVNTGFGPMASKLVGRNDLEKLQRNLVVSHACGGGEPVSDEYVLCAMAVRLNTLLRGNSGVSKSLLELLAKLINARFAPIVPEHGGVGASGDLIQLAHIALGIIGEGEVRLRGVRMPAKAAFKKLKLKPHALEMKEGLALINGTSFMAAIAALSLEEFKNVFSAVVRSSALSLEAAEAFEDCLAPFLHASRPHEGQREVASAMRRLVLGSKLLRSRRDFERSKRLGEEVTSLLRAAQDVYSIRCAPQILGPILETFRRVEKTIEIEINSATDNPIIDSGARKILHGGNFHGEYIGQAMDTLKAAAVKLSMLCERRINFFLHDKINGLYPPFLNAQQPGLTLGLQGLQFTATSTVAENQSLGYPHALHSIPSNADNQDVVSMGAGSALLAARVVRNGALVAAIESAALSQAFYIKSEKGLSPEGRYVVRKIRAAVKPVVRDRSLADEIQKLAETISLGELGSRVF